ncbi:MAG TPA: outer membrane beta-barrel domain-containing protein [Chromatiales bacterium]|nr:outer membrane beta-barrel domain-containing protein [Chromatiales bacterium]
MESRLRILFLITGLSILVSPPLPAAPASGEDAPVIQPAIERKEIKEARIDTENFEVGAYAGMMSVEDFGTGPVYGVRAAYHVTEDLFLEAAYGRSKAGETSYERLSGSAPLLTDKERALSYYNLSVGYNLLPGETFIGSRRAFNSALYIIGGIGSTDFAGDARFTLNLGAGYRLLMTDWLALHVDVRDHIFDIDVTGEDKTTHNIEINGGITFFF